MAVEVDPIAAAVYLIVIAVLVGIAIRLVRR